MVMKNLYGIIFAAMLSATIFCNDLYAQNKHDLLTGLDEHDFSTFTINGLVIGGPEEYTEQDIIDAFGQPDSVYYDMVVGFVYLYDMKRSSSKRKHVPIRPYCVEIAIRSRKNVILSGYVFKSASVYMVYMIPAIWIGNFVLIYAYKWIMLEKEKNYFLAGIIGIITKVLVIAGGFMLLKAFGIFPDKMVNTLQTAMTTTQLITASIGTVIAFIIYFIENKVVKN